MPSYLPGGETPDFKYRISLDGAAYDIRTRWNSRSESWFLYIGPTGRDPVLKTRLTTVTEILSRYSYEGLPPGRLFLVDTEKSFGRPGRDDFGPNKRFRLFYVNADEV